MPKQDRQALLRRICLLKLALTQTQLTYDDYRTMTYQGQPILYESIQDVRNTFDKDRKILDANFGVTLQKKPGIRDVYQVTYIDPELRDLYLIPEWLDVLAVLQLPQNAQLFPKQLLQALLADVQRRYGHQDQALSDVFERALGIAAWRDSDMIAPQLYQRLWNAQRENFVVEFDYLPARDDDAESRHHTVEPYRLYVDDGHLYLFGYCRMVDGPRGHYELREHLDYRLGRIVSDSLHISTERYLFEREPVYYTVHYILSEKVSRRGASQSFEREVGRQWLEDGRLEIRASTHRPLQAVQRLLRYGGQCLVLGGETIREAYLKELYEMLNSHPPD